MQESCKILCQWLVKKVIFLISFTFIWNKNRIRKFINLKHFLDKKNLKNFFRWKLFSKQIYIDLCKKKNFAISGTLWKNDLINLAISCMILIRSCKILQESFKIKLRPFFEFIIVFMILIDSGQSCTIKTNKVKVLKF